MDLTIRERIIRQFIARAAVILSSGSPQVYANNLGERVIRSRRKVSPNEAPCIFVFPFEESAEFTHGAVCHTMPIKVTGFVRMSRDDDESVISESILGDLIRCFEDHAWTSSILAESVLYAEGGEDEDPDGGSTIAGAAAVFHVKYWTVKGDPYSQ